MTLHKAGPRYECPAPVCKGESLTETSLLEAAEFSVAAWHIQSLIESGCHEDAYGLVERHFPNVSIDQAPSMMAVKCRDEAQLRLRSLVEAEEKRAAATESLAEQIHNAVTVQEAIEKTVPTIETMTRFGDSLAEIARQLDEMGLYRVETPTCFAQLSWDRKTVAVGRLI